MIRKAMSMAMFLIGMLCMSAQQLTPLPLQEGVKSGKLPNGLSYYILHNEEPKNRANFYIAQKVGSTLEEPTQLGLAHFLEHMAFNGTTHYPGKNMLNYLQSKGIRFGDDINAYTYFDETVYNINNVPTTDKALMDSVLLAIYDWSGSILLEDAEIDAERGVIEEEWRSRNDAGFRMLESVLPKIYSEYQYQQSVIGKMDIIRNFPYSEIKNYYKKWYRPDQQGVVIVGDFDAAEMEKKVVELFSTIPMPENPAPRTYPTVSDNKEPIFAYYEDPETRLPRVDLSFKFEKTPVEMRNTLEGFVQDDLLEELIAQLIDNRLEEYSQKPECKYMAAGVYFGDFWVSKTKGAFNVVCIAKDDLNAAWEEALGIVTRACKTGFTDSELERARDEILSGYEKKFNERGNTDSDVFGIILYRHFIDNKPAPGFENEYQIAQQILPMIPVQQLNMMAAELLTPENQVMIVQMPKKEGMQVITEQEFVANTEKILNAQYEAYQDEKITDPLVSNFRAAGKIVSEKAGPFETQEFELSNGAKVVVKTTDFKADEITLTAFANGGKRSFAESDALNIKVADNAYAASKLGNFNRSTLRKYLAGKNCNVGYAINNVTNSVSGYSSVKDLETMLQMVYASFVELTPDDEYFNTTMAQIRTSLEAMKSNPQYIFSTKMLETLYANNPMFTSVTPEELDKVDYAKSLGIVKNTLSNAADFTFIFVGNIDAQTLKPLLEKYIASLPGDASKKAVVKELSSINIAEGQVKNEWKQPMQAPSTTVYNVYSGTNVPYNVSNDAKISLIGDLLGNIFTETLREEEGGTYSPGAYAAMSPVTKNWTINYKFITNAAMQTKLIERANAELMKLLSEGANAEAFQKVKEAAVKQLENQLRSNDYWDSGLTLYYRGIDDITGAKEALESLTCDELNAFMKTLYNGQNRIQIIMEGVEEAK